jgi:lipopolysaccharide/colanic/teichoic acid biosynthesis glycosyltransferase
MKTEGRSIIVPNPLILKDGEAKKKVQKYDLSSIKSAIMDESFGIYDEDYFKELLILERKRSERSEKHFLLALIDVASLLKGKNRKSIGKSICTAVQASCREIDVKGWHVKNRIIGLIYVEVKVAKVEAIIKKLKDNLASELSSLELQEQPEISYVVFPDNQNNQQIVDDTTTASFYSAPDENKASMRVSLAIKRIIDFVVSFSGLCFFAPLMTVIAVLVKCTSKGPVFFKQKRLGIGGKQFTFLKFRSMYVTNNDQIHKDFVTSFIQNSDKNAQEGKPRVYKLKDDPRITPIGKFLRKTSLDELPQLINVLIGKMSLVGPRPCLPYEFEKYGLWHKRRILETKPGITCIWQVEGRSTTTFETMVRMDIQYIMQWSLFLDVKLLVKTPFAVIFAKGAY